ncbi:hypothetical protein PQQ49_34125 [Paraburkholderia strydomiana]
MDEILALVLLHDEQAGPAAVELALEAGTPSKQTVDGDELLVPAAGRHHGAASEGTAALTLSAEPQASVGCVRISMWHTLPFFAVDFSSDKTEKRYVAEARSVRHE